MNTSPSIHAARLTALAILYSLFGCALASASRPPDAPLPRVRVHAEGHYLETTDGKPFFWLGDTAWGLVHGLTREEASYYLDTRARQGFNVVQIVALDEVDARRASALYGSPLIDNDPLRPNEAYFGRIVEIVDEAASKGIYVVLLPAWGDKVSWGIGPRMFRLDNLDVARAYGSHLGARLKDRANVIWMLGGDRPPRLNPERPRNDARAAGFADDHDWRPIWREMAQGIAEGSGFDPLCLYHPSGTSYTSRDLHQETWLDINGMQSGHGAGLDFPVWDWIAGDFALEPVKPTLDLEPNYEDHPVDPWPRWDPSLGYFRDHDVRKQCYRSVLAGGCGVTYGHHAVWPFAGSRNPVINHGDRDWISALHRPAAQQMHHLRALIESRPFFSRVPDPSLARNSSINRSEHIVACRDREGTYAFVYFPNRDQTATIDLARLGARELVAWWHDPRTGFPHPVGAIEGGAARDFTSPRHGPDWVLVIDDAAAGYPRPGTPLGENNPR